MDWVVRTEDNVFVRDKGGEAIAAGEAVVTLTRDPDTRGERYDATSPTQRRPATPTELAAVVEANLDAGAKQAVDAERIFSALVYAIIDTYSPPATPAKYQVARTKIITFYKTRPWLT